MDGIAIIPADTEGNTSGILETDVHIVMGMRCYHRREMDCDVWNFHLQGYHSWDNKLGIEFCPGHLALLSEQQE